MRRLGLATAAALMTTPLLGLPAWAAPCVSGTVASYEVAGFSCNVDGVTFSNISIIPGGTGSVSLTSLSPFSLGGEFGLTLTYAATAGGAQNNADVAWTMDVSGNLLTDAFASLTGSVSGTGTANLGEQLINP